MIGRLLGIDHGLKRVGIAVSDALGISAREITILKNQGDDAVLYTAIQTIAREQHAVGLVVGYPSNDGGSSEQADIVYQWTKGLYVMTNLPIVLWDEQLSSADAKQLAKQQKRKPQAPIDDLAARVILQSYINAHGDNLAPAPSHDLFT